MWRNLFEHHINHHSQFSVGPETNGGPRRTIAGLHGGPEEEVCDSCFALIRCTLLVIMNDSEGAVLFFAYVKSYFMASGQTSYKRTGGGSAYSGDSSSHRFLPSLATFESIRYSPSLFLLALFPPSAPPGRRSARRRSASDRTTTAGRQPSRSATGSSPAPPSPSPVLPPLLPFVLPRLAAWLASRLVKRNLMSHPQR